MYRMAIGHAAFENEVQQAFDAGNVANQIIDGSFPQKKYHAHINKALQRIISKCLEVDPANRYQSVLEILNDLSDISDGSLNWRQDFVNPNVWTKVLDGAMFELILSNDRTSTQCHRVYSDGRPRRRFGEMSKTALTPAKLSKLFKDNG